MSPPPNDLLGAHVSTLGGVALAPGRGAAIGATAIQLFTKTPNQWREPVMREADVAAFRAALAGSGIRAAVAHDSYLINLASPDDALRAKSKTAFTGELQRSRALGIPWVVSHPGNYMDDRAAGLDRNARGYAECLAAVRGDVGVLIEGTAGAGTALGSTFDELRALRDALPADLRERVGFCLDTAHLHAAGYEVAEALDQVLERFDREVGLGLLKCLHLNDSKGAPGSRLDRHEWIGEGTIGPAPFRRIMRDERLAQVIKIIETPKGDDPIRHDRRMLKRLRAYARGSRSNARAPQTVGQSVIARTTTHQRMTRCLAALLLVLQGLAGGAVSLAHASERLTAPAHIEAQHGAGCLALHDSLRCGLCHFAGSQVTSQHVRTHAPAAGTVERRPRERDVAPASRPDRRIAPPRAPPASRS